MKKIAIIFLIIIAIIVIGLLLKSTTKNNFEKKVLFKVYEISKQYANLRYRTDEILTKADQYQDQGSWNFGIAVLITDWENFITDVELLKKDAELMSQETISLKFIQEVYAYDKTEISQVFDKAPAGKKIITLANHLGVDAKTAVQILQQDQAKVTAEAWKEEETFRKLEVSATVIKDISKVSVFAGTIVVTGGTAGVMAGSMVAKASVVVSGADLIMEVTDDVARIGLGDNNKISMIATDIRQVTEPLSGLLSIADMPKNLTKGIEKLNAVSFGAEQLNSVMQEGKIIGIELPSAKKIEKFQNLKKYKTSIYITSLNHDEVDSWLQDQTGGSNFDNTEEEIKNILGINNELAINNLEKQENLSSEEVIKSDNQAEIEKETKIEKNINQSEFPKFNDSEKNEIEKQENYLSNKILLIPKDETIGNDWQGALRISLFKNAPIEIVNNSFKVIYKSDYTFGEFSGTGEIKISGTYDPQTRIIQGSHYRKYEGSYKNEPRTIIYSGNFRQELPVEGEVKINFMGIIESTRLDGNGKSITTSSEGGNSQIYYIKVK